MKKFKSSISILLGVVLLLVFCACAPSGGGGGGDKTSTNKSVAEISVKKAPDKTEYFTNETFSVEGGVILVKYTDDSTEEVAMTDESVEITAPNTSRVGEKTVTVKYQTKKATFKINVSTKGFDVAFDYNYDGAPAATVKNVSQGLTVGEPDSPVRTGYTFYKWYADENCTVEYDFDTRINAPTTIYAQSKSEYKQIVKSNGKAVALAFTPERTDYRFVGWAGNAEGTIDFDLNAPVTGNTVAYAKWEKTKQGSSTYVFEAENVDLSQKAGPGYSGENAGSGMIVVNTSVSASGDKFVAYQCKNGNSLEFNIACDQDIANAQLIVRFAAEFSNMTLTSDTYSIYVNETKLSYSDIALTLSEDSQQGQFKDYVIANISLKKGANLIQLKTTNSNPLGGTLTATAPIIDCIKISTEAVVIWDGNYGLPANVD